MIGYTEDTTELNIPATFQADDGTWYRVTSIGDYAFYDCDNIESIIIPNSVTLIGNSVFSGRTNLTDIYYTGTEAEWNEITIAEDPSEEFYWINIYYNHVIS